MDDRPPKTILVVEDDKFLTKVYSSKFDGENVTVEYAKNGEEGLTKIMRVKPDLVLLDIVMPKMNGFQILEAMRNNDELKDIKVVVLSNLGQEQDMNQARELGVVDYIVKSESSIDDVMRKIKQYLYE